MSEFCVEPDVGEISSHLSNVTVKDKVEVEQTTGKDSVKLRYRPGDIICQADRPIAKVLNINLIDKVCASCLLPAEKYVTWTGPCCPAEDDEKISPLKFNSCPTGDHPLAPPPPACVAELTPCSGPCAGNAAWYCSKKCETTDLEAGHKLECSFFAKYPIIGDNGKTTGDNETESEANEISKLWQLNSFRLALRLWFMCWENAQVLTQPDWLATDGSRRSLSEFASHLQMIEVKGWKEALPWFIQVLQKEGFLHCEPESESESDPESDQKESAGGVKMDAARLKWFICMVITNAIGMRGYVKDERLGSSVYGNESRFNHSCRPNARWYQDGTRLTVRAITPIPEDEPVTISYIPNSSDRAKRQHELKSRYYFDCQCVECVHHPESHKINVDERGSILASIKSKNFDRIRLENDGKLILSIDAVLHHLQYCFNIAGREVEGEGKNMSKALGKDLSEPAARRLMFHIASELEMFNAELVFPDEGNTEDLVLRYTAALAAQSPEGVQKLSKKPPARKELLKMARDNYFFHTPLSYQLNLGKCALMSLALHGEAMESSIKQVLNECVTKPISSEDLDILSDYEVDDILSWVGHADTHVKVTLGEETPEYSRFWSLVLFPLAAIFKRAEQEN